MLATIDDPGKIVQIISIMPTMNGMACVMDTKILQKEGIVQTLVIKNRHDGMKHTTTRYFVIAMKHLINRYNGVCDRVSIA